MPPIALPQKTYQRRENQILEIRRRSTGCS